MADPIDTLATGTTPWNDSQLHARFRGTDVRLSRLRRRIEELDRRLGDALVANLAYVNARASDEIRTVAMIVALLAAATLMAVLWPMIF